VTYLFRVVNAPNPALTIRTSTSGIDTEAVILVVTVRILKCGGSSLIDILKPFVCDPKAIENQQLSRCYIKTETPWIPPTKKNGGGGQFLGQLEGQHMAYGMRGRQTNGALFKPLCEGMIGLQRFSLSAIAHILPLVSVAGRRGG
jgi:hypothetical protein